MQDFAFVSTEPTLIYGQWGVGMWVVELNGAAVRRWTGDLWVPGSIPDRCTGILVDHPTQA